MVYSYVLVLFTALTFAVLPAQSGSKQPTYFMENNKFINGFDPVSYFDSSGPQKGSDKIKSTLGSGEVFFVNIENKKKFDQNPEKYIPAYNGYCAYAMAKDKFYKVKPESYKIIDGKVYLFYENVFVKTLKKWNKDEAKLKAKADTFWKAHEG